MFTLIRLRFVKNKVGGAKKKDSGRERIWKSIRTNFGKMMPMADKVREVTQVNKMIPNSGC